MDAKYRILDANFNRAREALRVMEDYARFELNHTRLSSQAKQLRHLAQLRLDGSVDFPDLVPVHVAP